MQIRLYLYLSTHRFDSLESTLFRDSRYAFSFTRAWFGVLLLFTELDEFIEDLSNLYLNFQMKPLHVFCLPLMQAAILPPLELSPIALDASI